MDTFDIIDLLSIAIAVIYVVCLGYSIFSEPADRNPMNKE